MLLGLKETVHVIDGSRMLRTNLKLADYQGPLNFGAPALAYAAMGIAKMEDPAKRARMNNRLEDLVNRGRRTDDTGLSVPVGRYTIWSFGIEEIEIFPRIREALAPKEGAQEIGVLMLQHLAIALIRDQPLLLNRDGANQEMHDRLQQAGLPISVEWTS